MDWLVAGLIENGHGSDGAIGDALIYLVAAVLVAPLLRRLRFSLVLGYVAAGAIIGPGALGLVADTPGTRELAEFGVVFLLFAIGLELSLERLKVLRRLVFGLGAAQVAATAVVIGTTAFALGLSVPAALVVGWSLALSSTAFGVQLLAERGELATRHGQATFAVLLLQDLAVVPALVLIPILGGDSSEILLTLLLAAVKAAVALGLIVLLGRLLLRPLFRLIAIQRASELTTAATLLSVLGIGWATQSAGLSMALGAFLAGLLLSESEFRHQVEADIEPFRGILLGLFFITVGMSIDLGLLVADIERLVLLLVALVAAKMAILFALGRAFGLATPTALRVGALLAQGGEFAFVILGQAAGAALVDGGTVQLLYLVVAVSLAVTPAVVHLTERLLIRLEGAERAGEATMAGEASGQAGHVVICGFGRAGRIVGQLLAARGVPFVAVDLDPAGVGAARSQGMAVHYGDASRPEVQRLLGIERARAVVVSFAVAHVTTRAVEHLRQGFPETPIYVRARDAAHARELDALGVRGIVLETLEASLQLAGNVLHDLGHGWDEVESLIQGYRHVEGVGSLQTGFIGAPQPGRPAPPAEAVPEQDPVLAAAALVAAEEAAASEPAGDAGEREPGTDAKTAAAPAIDGELLPPEKGAMRPREDSA